MYIVFDCYHIMVLMNNALDEIRRSQQKELNKIKTLKRQAYGFRDMVYFKLRLYHHPLVLSLPPYRYLLVFISHA